MSTEKIQLKKIPLTILDDSFEFIRDFSTFFIVNGKLFGSGTFVRLNRIDGILTAHHVWDSIVQSGATEVGIQISYRQHRFTIPIECMVPCFGLRGHSAAFGPDVIFIKIPLAKVGAIKARKSFYNLDVRNTERQAQAKNRYGLCIVAGCPGNQVKLMSTIESNLRVVTVFVLGSILGRTRVRQRTGFDYWELKTLSRKNGQAESFGGMSGGGVWKVIFQKKHGEPFEKAKVAGVYLGGVAFYQSALRGEWRFLRAHGPKTIYRKLRHLKK